MSTVQTWGFTLRLNREPTDAELDLLYDAGCDDAAPEGGLLHFDRAADNILHAVVSATDDVARVPGLWSVGVVRQDVVSLREIASRLERTYESARLLAEGKRGPGGFPAPVIDIGSTKLYLWVDVERWAHHSARLPTRSSIEADQDLTLADALLTVRARLKDMSPPRREEIMNLLTT
jgi:hypothetical protein